MGDGAFASARYRVLRGASARQYQFFCELSGALVCTTKPICFEPLEQELRFAWESEGKRHFNRCRCCGKWVSDVMYNADTLECVFCSPWEEQPNYCPHCGAAAEQGAVFCHSCRRRLQYGWKETI